MSWQRVKLGEVCSIEKGNIGITKAIAGEYPLLVLGEERKTHNEYQFDDEAVIIPLVSSTGHGHKSLKRIHFQKGKFAVGSILCAVIPKNKKQLSAEFLYRYLDLNKEKELVSRMKGMANVSLPIKEIALIEIPIPPLEEQKRIVEKLKKLESNKNLISSELNQQLALVKELRQAYLREAMQGKLVAQSLLDEPAEMLLEKIKAEKEKLVAEGKIKRDKPLPPIKDEEIPFDVPGNWVWCRLGEILTEIKYGTSKSCDYDYYKNTPILRIPNISSGFIDGEDMKYTDLSENEMLELKLEENDILTIRSNGSREIVGKTVLVTKEFVGYAFAGYLIRLRFNKILVCSHYLLAVTRSPFFRDLIETPLRTTVGINNINGTEISNLLVPLPPLAEQERIVAKLEKLMKFCDDLEQNIKQSIKQAEMLLETALSEALQPSEMEQESFAAAEKG